MSWDARDGPYSPVYRRRAIILIAHSRAAEARTHMTANTLPLLTPATLRARGIGIIVCAGFAAVWANAARTGWAPVYTWLTLLVTAVLSGALLVGGIMLIRRGRRLSRLPGASGQPPRRMWRMFTVVLILEIIALNILAYLLAGHHLMQYLMPGIAIIVGLHFFPLARTFHARHLNTTAAVMTLAGAAAVWAIAVGSPATAASSVSDVVCALTLWVTGFVSWYRNRLTPAAWPFVENADV